MENDGKTFVEVLGLMLTAITHPKINLSLLAQSKEAAAGLLSDKVQEICQFYPMIEDCIKTIKKSNSDYEIIFKNGARITNLASAQTSKGKRRHRKQFCDYRVIGNGHDFKTSNA